MRIFLSLDGARRETHDKIRGPGTWEKALAAARRMARLKIRFSTVFAAGRPNSREAGESVRLAWKLGATSACVIPVMPVGRATRDLALGVREMAEVLKRVQ